MSEIYLTVVQGGFAGFQKLAVIKLLRRDLAEEDEFRRMFLDEARLAARLNHPNVVQTYDVGEDHGRYFIAMEYLEGQTFERVRRARNSNRLFPIPLQIQMLSQVLAGLHYAHSLADYDDTPIPIVHRDVTPSNVVITYDGQVKLIDFGIAKILDSVNHTGVGVLKGKARYMAPEQVSATGDIDRRADIYSVGVMLWETLAGKYLWSGLSEAEMLRRSGEVPPLPSEAPAMLQQICMKAMAHRPADRYPTADALRADLDLYLAQNATPTRDRDVGAMISELFSDERARIRHLIDAQLKGTQPGARLPAFRDLRAKSVFDTPFAGAAVVAPRLTGHGASLGAAVEGVRGSGPLPVAPPAGSSVIPRDASSLGSLPQPAAFPAPRRRRRHAALAGGIALVGAGVAVVALTRGDHPVIPAPAPSAPPAAPVAPAAGGAERARVATLAREAAAPPHIAVRGVTDDTITLGMSAAFSGSSRELGSRMKLGLDTAFARVNDAGGVAGRRIELVALDDGYEGPRALANVRELIGGGRAFAIIGDVGTPTAQDVLPYLINNKIVMFGAFSGSAILRRDPPDRYVFNYRASYEEETARMVNYLIDVAKVPDHSIAVFAQNDGYGDAGYDGATKMLRRRGRDDELLRAGYDRNTLAVDDAVARIAAYDAAASRGADDTVHQRHPVKAIIMVATYKAAARFIQKIRDRKLDPLLLNVSFVGSNSLAEELGELGPSYTRGVIVTQVVPHYESNGSGVLRYRNALQKYHPDQQPDFVSLEGFIVGELFAEGLRRVGRTLDTEALVDALEHIDGFDPGIGGSLGFSASRHQASHRIWGTQLDDRGAFVPIEME